MGGVIGGTLSSGVLHVGDEIEIRPGIRTETKGKTSWEPIITTVESLHAGGKPLKRVDDAWL